MKAYIQQLNLTFDPFDPAAVSKGLFEGGTRQHIREKIIERAMYSESVISVFGCLGSGKSTLLAAISKSFSDEAVVVNIAATLFMNPDQFLDELVSQLQLSGDFTTKEDRVGAVVNLANELDLEARSLLIQIDDAQELNGEVVADLLALKQASADGAVHIILFGESQLGNMLESTLPDEELANLAEFELSGLGSEDTFDYIRFKLEAAGYSKPLPLAGNILGGIHNSSNGIPGAINALVSDALQNEMTSNSSAAVAGPESEGSVDSEPVDPESPVETSSSARRYFVAASILLALFAGAIIFLQSEEQSEVAATQIPVSVNSGAIQTGLSQPTEEVSVASISERTRVAEVVESDNEVASSVKTDVEAETDISFDAMVEESAGENSLTEVAIADTRPESEIEQDSQPTSVTPDPIAAAIASDPVGSLPVSSVEPVTEVTEPVVVANDSGLSSFERNILSLPGSNYTVQIVGSSSESNIQAFIDANELGNEAGYFETRLNEKPWFVVVTGNFSDKTVATSFLDSLPDSAKSSGPWVRSFAGIQSDIQNLASR